VLTFRRRRSAFCQKPFWKSFISGSSSKTNAMHPVLKIVTTRVFDLSNLIPEADLQSWDPKSYVCLRLWRTIYRRSYVRLRLWRMIYRRSDVPKLWVGASFRSFTYRPCSLLIWFRLQCCLWQKKNNFNNSIPVSDPLKGKSTVRE